MAKKEARRKPSGEYRRAESTTKAPEAYPFWARPEVGSCLTVLAAVCFLVQLMILPLVGPCGARAPHRVCNYAAFTAWLLLTAAVAATATFSKLERRKIDGSPLPWFSLGLCAGCLFIFVCLVTGLFAI